MEVVLTTFLAPFLPYLIKAGEEVASKAAKAFGEGAWRLASTIWKKLQPAIDNKEAAREASADLAGQPDDQRTRAAFELQIEKLLRDNKSLADEVEALLDEGQRDGIIASSGAVVIGGDVRADRGGVAAGRDIHLDQGGISTGRTEADLEE